MTFKEVCNGCDPAETARRQEVCVRFNILFDKLNACDDDGKRKRIEANLKKLKRQEAPWLKDIAFFLY